MLCSAALLSACLLAPSTPTLLYVKSGDPRTGTELMTTSAAGQRSLGLSQPESAGALSAAVSPDQKRLAFLSGNKLYVAPIVKGSAATGAVLPGRTASKEKVIECAARRQRDGSWTGAIFVAEGLTGPVNWCGPSDLVLMRPLRALGAEGDIVRLTIRTDGSLERERQLTNVGSTSHRDSCPSVTRDGRKLLFVRVVNLEGPQLITASAEGGREVQLRPGTGIWGDCTWSLDGSKIAAYQTSTSASPAEPGAYVMNSDGSGAIRVPELTSDDRNLLFTIDGRELTFAREFHSRVIHQKDIFRAPISASGPARPFVASPGLDERPLQWVSLT